VAGSDPVGPALAVWQARVARVQALAQSMKAVAQRNRDSQLAEITAALFVCVAEMASALQQESTSFTLTTQDYATREGIPLRTVQRQCRNRKLPAILVDGTWRISDEAHCE